MKAHVITIGDEILIGQTLNTNAAYIGEKLSNLQIDLTSTSVVGDNETAILDDLKRTFNSNDLVIITGGLGPTHDDVTRKCIVKFFETELVKNEDVLEDIRKLFKQRGRDVTKINEDQANVPKIAKIIRNGRGTAPGVWIEKDKKVFVAMPGVPYEMKSMMDDFVVPKLQSKMDGIKSVKKIKNLLTTGIPESHLYERLGNLDELLQDAKLAFLPNQFGVKLRITVHGDSEEEVGNRLTEIEQRIRSLVGRYIYGKDDETLEDVVARLLIDRGLSLSVAESCTGGLICHRLTNIAGSSSYFERGLVSYSNGAKVELLEVDEDMMHEFGAVSLEVARQMANGVKAASGTDLGISVTGIMGPTGATEDKPVGLVFIGICDDKMCTAKEFHFGDDRLLNKDRTSQAALEMLRRNLLGIPYDE
ncbi:MAG: competence/damage-inducible protein A [Melioribacteraceae bacterium]|nr:competence/damage-inducible protein A [Melioribacteraceae bacterium]MCF8352806.1 competence/damage-inducible protein A [Melioribacteraceae bacterium]MCF8393474.1 competence/damage-inducible protein A [Melioribacteraceae bacterium]MCF8417323.1 competence/damage-inducible protein A [Melioribacteraceae bacterium]